MVIAFSGTATSVAANSTSADLATGTYQFVPKGIIRIYCKPSVTGLQLNFKSNGIPIADRASICWFGASGGITQKDNLFVEQLVNPGRLELSFTNTTGGAITVDYIVTFDAVK